MVLRRFCFVRFSRCTPRLACAFTAWAKPRHPVFFAFVFAAAWTFAEYLRAHLFTGFEWLSVGCRRLARLRQISHRGAAAFRHGLVVVAAAGYIAATGVKVADANGSVRRQTPRIGWQRRNLLGCFCFLGFFGLVGNAFTSPTGKSRFKVSLLRQRPQSMKWEPEKFVQTLQLYENSSPRPKAN